MDFLIKLIETQGVIAALFVYLLYTGKQDARKDYEGVCKRLNEQEDFIKSKLITSCEKQSSVIEKSTDVTAEIKSILIEHQRIMKTCAWQKD